MAKQEKYAGFWLRLVAYFIDYIILSGGLMIIGYILGILIGIFLSNRGMDEITIMTISMLLGLFVGLISSWLYFTLLESSFKQATLGKMAMGIFVTDINGNRISFAKANVRYWSKFMSGFFIGFGFLMIAFTEKKQGLHDKLANCLVLKK